MKVLTLNVTNFKYKISGTNGDAHQSHVLVCVPGGIGGFPHGSAKKPPSCSKYSPNKGRFCLEIEVVAETH